MTESEDFAKFMASTSAVMFGDFTLKSGKKSNIFINFGNLSGGAELARLGHFFARAMIERGLTDIDVVFGPAYKGINIALATCIALATEFGIDKPFAYNRKVAKDHGEGGNFVGYDLTKARSILVVDDVITDGVAKYETIEMLKAFPKAEIAAILIGVDREDVDEHGVRQSENFARKTAIPVHSITTKSGLLRCKGMS